MTLLLKEIQFFENISFSMSEEIDIFYCLASNPTVFKDIRFDKDSIKEKLITIVDTLENRREGDQYR